jgi:hypothetical protein
VAIAQITYFFVQELKISSALILSFFCFFLFIFLAPLVVVAGPWLFFLILVIVVCRLIEREVIFENIITFFEPLV